LEGQRDWEDEYNAMDVPVSWPDHLEAAIEYLNNCILPNLKFSPNELLLGIMINMRHTPADQAQEEVATNEVEIQMAYVEQQGLDRYAYISSRTYKWKLAFNRKFLSQAPREIIFNAGQLVQVYRSNLDFTFKAHLKGYTSATSSQHDNSTGSFCTAAQHYRKLRQPLRNYRVIKKPKKT
jgi:hypothetical protein